MSAKAKEATPARGSGLIPAESVLCCAVCGKKVAAKSGIDSTLKVAMIQHRRSTKTWTAFCGDLCLAAYVDQHPETGRVTRDRGFIGPQPAPPTPSVPSASASATTTCAPVPAPAPAPISNNSQH